MIGNEFAVVPLEVIQDKRLTLEQTRVLVAKCVVGGPITVLGTPLKG